MHLFCLFSVILLWVTFAGFGFVLCKTWALLVVAFGGLWLQRTTMAKLNSKEPMNQQAPRLQDSTADNFIPHPPLQLPEARGQALQEWLSRGRCSSSSKEEASGEVEDLKYIENYIEIHWNFSNWEYIIERKRFFQLELHIAQIWYCVRLHTCSWWNIFAAHDVKFGQDWWPVARAIVVLKRVAQFGEKGCCATANLTPLEDLGLTTSQCPWDIVNMTNSKHNMNAYEYTCALTMIFVVIACNSPTFIVKLPF